MKIVFVLNFFMPHQYAGTEIYVLNLSKGLLSIGFDVRILIPNFGNALGEEYEYDGVKVYKYGEPSIIDRDLIIGKRLPDGLLDFERYLEITEPDIIHFHEFSHSAGVGLAHLKIARRLSQKVFATFHLSHYSCKTGTLMRNGLEKCDGIINEKKCAECFLVNKGINYGAKYFASLSSILRSIGLGILPRNKLTAVFDNTGVIIRHRNVLLDIMVNCDKIVCIADWYMKVLKRNIVDEQKLVFIPTSIPRSENTDMSTKEIGVNNGKFKLLFIGRISKYKGLHLLIDALESLNSSDLELHIYGPAQGGDYESNLKMQTKGNDNIYWNSFLEPNLVINEMRKFDLLCLCSTFSEMSPLVIQEARFAGIPVLASDVYGNAEQIKDGENGFLFEYNSAFDLTKKLDYLIKNKTILDRIRKNITIPDSYNDMIFKHQTMYEGL
jgi:glycosyltransferase involved in cell wall biosynthesis